MRLKIFLLLLLIAFIFAVSCKKQASKDILLKTDILPIPDGTISESEYTIKIQTEKMEIHLSRNSEKLLVGLTGKTMGWTSIGFGAMGMDKSHLIMGYMKDNTMVFKEHTGRGHRHQPADRQILVEPVITEKNGYTTFEGAVRAGDVIQPGKNELYIIIACGEDDNITSRHIFRKSFLVKIGDN